MIRTYVINMGRNRILSGKLVAADAGSRHSSQTDKLSYSARLTCGLLLIPVFLAVAICVGRSVITLPEILFIGLSFTGLMLVLLAVRALLQNEKLFALTTFVFYSAILAGVIFYSVAENPLLWALVLALPLECWLVGRNRTAVVMGSVSAGLIAGIALVANLQQLTGVTAVFLIGLAGLLLYIGGFLLRIIAMPAQFTDHNAREFSASADLENALDALVLRLDNDGYIRSLSQRSMQQFGVESQVLCGTLLLDRVHVADRVNYLTFLAGLRGLPLQGKAVTQTEVRLRCVDTSTTQPQIFYESFRLEGQIQDFVQAEQTATGFILIAHNIAHENALRDRTSAQRVEIENMETSRDHFLDTVSHELRTPLNSIIGFSDLLLHDVAGPLPTDKQREYIDLIKMSGTHLLNVVNAILEASRLEAGQYPVEMESFALRDSVGLCTAMLMPLADKKNVQLSERIQSNVGEIIADRRAVQQILINLLSNAIKFTGQGGCVTIDAMIEPEGKHYQYQQEPMLVLSVSDTGIGLTQEEIDRLCHPFSQINNVHTRLQEGSGLGLYLVKGLVQLLDGKLEIQSNKGEGTTIRITLPLRPVKNNITDSAQGSAARAAAATIIDMQTLQEERRCDGSAAVKQGQTQGDIHAQKLKTG